MDNNNYVLKSLASKARCSIDLIKDLYRVDRQKTPSMAIRYAITQARVALNEIETVLLIAGNRTMSAAVAEEREHIIVFGHTVGWGDDGDVSISEELPYEIQNGFDKVIRLIEEGMED